MTTLVDRLYPLLVDQDFAQADRLLSKSSLSSIDSKNNQGQTLLMLASANNQPNLTFYLLEEDANKNLKDDFGNTALNWAVLSGCFECAETLIEFGANPNIYNIQGQDPYTNAQLLELENFQNILKPKREIQNTIFESINENDLSLFELYVTPEIYLSFKNKYDQTPLMNASFLNQIEMVKKLLDNGVNPNIKDSKGNTALIFCLFGNKDDIYETVSFLLLAGADPSEQNNKGERVIDFARKTRNQKVISLIESFVLEESQFNILGKELFDKACAGSYGAVFDLIQRGANVNYEEDGLTPLLMAIQCGNTSIVRDLINAGADVNFIDKQGRTPLINAVITQQGLIVELLLEKGAGKTKRVRDIYGKRALDYANEYGRGDLIYLL